MPDEPLQSAFISQGFWLALAILGSALRGGPLNANLGLVRGHWTPRQVAAVVFGFLLLSTACDLFLRFASLRADSQLASLDREVEGLQHQAAAVMLAFGLLPGIAEELLFRGFALGALRNRLGVGASIVISSALFGLAHGEWAHGSMAFLLGLYLGAAAVFSGSVWPAIACHALNNILGVLTALSGAWQLPNLGPLMVLGLALVALAILRASAGWNRQETTTPEGTRLQPKSGSADVEG